MKSLSLTRRLALAAVAAISLGLAACGGGGGDSSTGGGGAVPGVPTSFSGTVAKGAPLAGATVLITAANGQTITAVTNANGSYTTGNVTVTYPIVVVASLGSVSLKSIGFNGSNINATPLTDLLVTTILSAASTGTTPLTLSQFTEKVKSDSTFATNVSKAETVAQYRDAVIAVVKAELVASGKSSAEADTILAAVKGGSFESAPLVIGSPADQVLDNTAGVIQNADGSVKASVSVKSAEEGNKFPPPASQGSGV